VLRLRDGLKSIRGMRRALTEDEQHKIAEKIVAHLGKSQLEDREGTARRRARAIHHPAAVNGLKDAHPIPEAPSLRAPFIS
jgi:hypothetical protein